MGVKEQIKIHIVDDMSVSRGLLTQSLEELGIKNIDFDTDGKTALARLLNNPVHLVISDYNMPGMNGLDLLENLRLNRATQRIGFILVTGSTSPEIVNRGIKLGVNNIIRKPFTTATLKSAIEAVFGKL